MTYVLAIGDRELLQLVAARLAAVRALRPAGHACGPRRLYAPEFAAVLAGFGRRRHRAGAARSRRTGRRRALGHASPSPRPWPSAIPTAASGPRDPAGAGAGAHAGGGDARELPARCASACPMNLRRAYVGFEPRRGGARRPRPDRGALARGAGAPPAGAARGSSAPTRSPTSSSRRSRRASPPTACPSAPRPRPTSPRTSPTRPSVAWRAEGLADPVVQPRYDLDLPERPWPGPAAPARRPSGSPSPAAAPRSSRAMSASTSSLPMSFSRSW